MSRRDPSRQAVRRRRHHLLAIGVMLAASIAAAANAAAINGAIPLVSRFNNGEQNWTAGVSTVIHHEPSGGNPGGHLVVTDNGAVEDMRVFAPPIYTGNRSAYDGGIVSFDVLYIPQGSGQLCLGTFGQVRLIGAGMTVVRDVAGCPTADCWRRYDAPLTADFWGVSQDDWVTILSNLTEVSVRMEAVVADEANGLDNFAFLPPGVGNADLSGDGMTNAEDLAVLLGSWGPCGTCCNADFDGDGTVGPADLAILLGAWG